ncbi:hypothetical protein KFE25_011342 [Diacronema lutheri]|uniref:Phytanoyl-CoA dioxygenase n=1 Tax=Diacronema lutheri TaxID=2081491 RepID=A0A8J6C397_DIALT|nr:hypothetical protein KFE25_011342 [Diacronema lutheri]
MAAVDEAMRTDGYVVLRGRIAPEAVSALVVECELLAAEHERRRRTHAAAAAGGGADGGGECDDPLLDPFEWTGVPEADAARVEPLAWLRVRAGAMERAAGGARATEPWDSASGALARLLLVELPALVGRACAPNALAPCRLFGEHFIRKRPRSSGSYSWHTDAAEQLAFGARERKAAGEATAGEAYVSAWLPLDVMSERNGCLVLWPRDRPQPPGVADAPASAAAAWLDRAARRAPPHAGAVVLSGLAPGDCVLFGATLWHRSGPNRTAAPRRAYQAQYLLPRHCAYQAQYLLPADGAIDGPSPLGFAVAPLGGCPRASAGAPADEPAPAAAPAKRRRRAVSGRSVKGSTNCGRPLPPF